MNADASWSLQRVIVEELESSKALQEIMGAGFRVRDQSAPREDLPALVLGRSQVRAWRSASFEGQEHRIRFISYNGEGGSEVARRIANIVIGRLHDADLPVPGHALVDLQFEYSETRYLEAEKLFQTMLEFKALTVSD